MVAQIQVKIVTERVMGVLCSPRFPHMKTFQQTPGMQCLQPVNVIPKLVTARIKRLFLARMVIMEQQAVISLRLSVVLGTVQVVQNVQR